MVHQQELFVKEKVMKTICKMETWQIILAMIIVGLSIVMPIYYSYKKKKLAQLLKEGREVTEREKIRVYMNNINEKFRSKHK